MKLISEKFKIITSGLKDLRKKISDGLSFAGKVKAFGFLFLVAVLISPYIINELYKQQDGYLTLWNAEAMLQYTIASYGSIGTIILGIITLYVNSKLKNANEELVNLNRRISKLTEDSLTREKRTELPIVDFVKVGNDDHFKAKFTNCMDKFEIRIWMYNPSGYGVKKAFIESAILNDHRLKTMGFTG